MITGPSNWLTALQLQQKWALYYLYFPSFGIYVLSFIPVNANVTLP